MQSDWLTAGPYNTIRTTFFNFCRKSSIFQFPLFWHRKFSKFQKSFYLVLFWDTLIPDKRFIMITTTNQTMCRSCKKVVFVYKMMLLYNKRFTNRVTRAALEIRSPHFYARPSQDRAVRKRSGFIFPTTDRVTQLVNR